MAELEKEKKNTKTALETAYAYLANRMRTKAEVEKHLADKGYSAPEVTETVNELIGMRYIDDHLYAVSYYEYNREKKRGVQRAERELIEKGVDRETARFAKEDFLFENSVDEYEDALAIARRELIVPSDVYGGEPEIRVPDEKLCAKIARKLGSKGYSNSDIFRVLDTVRREAREADEG